jgi:hypothetical protein
MATLDDLTSAWKAFKGWFAALFKALNFMSKREHLIKKAHQSVKTNTFFVYFIATAIIMWLIVMLALHHTEPKEVSVGFIASIITVMFFLLIGAIIYCNMYHNKRPAS